MARARTAKREVNSLLIRIVTMALIFGGSVSASSPAVQVQKSCREHPQLVGKCFSVHGRLSSYNGNPSVRLWNLRTKRMLGISDQHFNVAGYRNLPEDLATKLDGETNIYADFLVCPFTYPRPREMRLVCVESARHVMWK